MNIAYPFQKIQDWITQQWVILTGKKIDNSYTWLLGPCGNLNGIGEEFIKEMAAKENLIIDRNTASQGLLSSFHELNLQPSDLDNLSAQIIDFYEKTADYDMHFHVQWNPIFKFFGWLLNQIFSNRIKQLHIPTQQTNEQIKSEIIKLRDAQTQQIKYTIWLRSIPSTGKIIYSGVYGTCILPNGLTCIKAIFPLPKGNATVLLKPAVETGQFSLISSGQKFGDPGFYFLLQDSKGNYWSRYLSSFRDTLCLSVKNNKLLAKQTLTLWNFQVLSFDYQIERKKLN